MKRLFYGLALLVLGFGSQGVMAACGDSGGGSLNDPFGNYSYGTLLSSYITDGVTCEEYVMSPSDEYEDLEKQHSGTISPDGSLQSDISVTTFSFSGSYQGAYDVSINGDVGDVLTFVSSVGGESISGTLCHDYTASPVSPDDLSFSSGAISQGTGGTPLFLSADLSSAGQNCVSGNFVMQGVESKFWVQLDGTLTDSSGNKSLAGNFTLDTLPQGVNCSSLSGTFPGCVASFPYPDNVDPKKCKNGCENSVGNPINFSLGYKYQNETDYEGGYLKFARSYRSDVTWYTNNVGQRWRHNYDRNISVVGSIASMTNEEGLVHTFVDDGNGNWLPISNDNDVVATLVTSVSGYLYTSRNDRKEYYDTSGKLTRIEYLGSESLDFVYDGSGRLSSVTDENGLALTFSYVAAETRISSVGTPSGTYSYAYDANGNLASVTKPDSKTRVYHYEDTNFVNAMTGITDENGVRYATYGYDAFGRAISSQHAGGVDSYTITYNLDDTVTATNPLGKQTTYTFQTILGVRKIVSVQGHASANCAAANKAYTYDARGFLASKTDWKGNVTTYIRDARGLVTSMKEAVSVSGQRTTTYTNHPVFHVPVVKFENGIKRYSSYIYDTFGRQTSSSVRDFDASSPTFLQTRTTGYVYYNNTVDGNGNIVLGRLGVINGPRDDVLDTMSYIYDENNRLKMVMNSYGHATTTTSFDSANRPLTQRDANSVQTTYVYDALGRLSSSTNASGTALAATTVYTYDDVGNIASVTAPNGAVLTYTYDDAYRLTGITDALGNSITFTLDNAGNRIGEVYKDSSSVLRYTSNQVFDELSRIIESVDANSDKTTFAYDVNGNQTSVTDGNFKTTTFAFDGLNRLVGSTDALSGQTVNNIDVFDQITSVTDPRNNATTYKYNSFGDLVSETSPDRGTISYVTDAAGNIVKRTDARGIVADYSYDALNRLTSVSYPSDATLNVILAYDSGGLLCGYSKGRLCSVTDASGSRAYIYDALGRVTKVTETRGSLSFITLYGYDLAGVLTSVTLPSGRVVTYGLDANGQVSSVSADVNSVNASLASSITYLPFGKIESMTYGNGKIRTNIYNTAYQLTEHNFDGLIYDEYLYDGVGNITSSLDSLFGYDALNRLTSEDHLVEGLFGFSYDAIGNRLTEDHNSTLTNYTYPLDSSKLSAIDAVSITTDAAGNITADNQRTYVIDAAGHVKEVKISGATVGSYIYDANNQRSQKTVSGTTTYYVYGKNGLLYGEYDATGALIREYVYLNGKPLAQVDAGESLVYLHSDYQGTPRFATNASGSEVWSNWTDAFGKASPSGSATVNLRFSGQYFDSESGLHYNWNRYYDPDTGRYITSDPIGLEGGLNTYAYVSANPVMYVDPEGKAIAVPIGYVLWGGTIISAQACALIQQCKDYFGDTLQNIADGVGETIQDIVDWCTGNSDDSGCKAQDSKKIAEQKAYAWAGLDLTDPNVHDIPPELAGGGKGSGGSWGDGRGNGKVAMVKYHPEGHPSMVGGGHPNHHKCAHYHATNSSGVEMIFTHK